MKRKEFEPIVEEIFEECKKTLVKKGREYQSAEGENEDVFANFKRTAKELNGIDPFIPIKLFLNKHWDSVTTFVKDIIKEPDKIDYISNNMSEPIKFRIVDTINYLILLYAYFIERIREWREKNVKNKLIKNSSKPLFTEKVEEMPGIRIPDSNKKILENLIKSEISKESKYEITGEEVSKKEINLEE